MTNTLKITVRNVYGNQLIYPADSFAEKMAQLSGQKTFSPKQIRTIESMGFLVVEVSNNEAILNSIKAA